MSCDEEEIQHFFDKLYLFVIYMKVSGLCDVFMCTTNVQLISITSRHMDEVRITHHIFFQHVLSIISICKQHGSSRFSLYLYEYRCG